MVDLNTSGKAKKKGVPPLVWIILAIVAGWITFAFVAGEKEPAPLGQDPLPQLETGKSYMPEAPARGDAPPVDGRYVNPEQGRP